MTTNTLGTENIELPENAINAVAALLVSVVEQDEKNGLLCPRIARQTETKDSSNEV